jgi:hypothetical protein
MTEACTALEGARARVLTQLKTSLSEETLNPQLRGRPTGEMVEP